MTSFDVRPADADDAATIHELRSSMASWLLARGVRQWGVGEVPLDEIDEQVVRGEWHVAVRRGELLGTLRLLWSDPPVWQQEDAFAAYVHGLMVPRNHAGQGVGAGLLQCAEERARARDAPALRLDCVESNLALRAYYADLGFEEVGRRDFAGPWHSAVLLEKQLQQPS